MRREYVYAGLNRENLLQNPLEQFKQWLKIAVDAQITDPTAMTLATVNAEGKPSQRVVLLKGADEKGFVFYTNLGSRKAHDIADNNQVALHFAWLELDRQVKLQGVATQLSAAEAFKYFASRPKDSQIAAWASHQSRSISSRQLLETAFAQMKQKFSDGDIPLPSFWGGYRVAITRYEFWQGRENRLHDSFSYEKNEAKQWQINRLAP